MPIGMLFSYVHEGSLFTMNKKINTVIFIICATIFLSICILGIFFGLLVLVFNVFSLRDADPSVHSIVLMIIFIVSLVGGLIIYNLVVKAIMKKFNLEKFLSFTQR